jgi:hypothetical protein
LDTIIVAPHPDDEIIGCYEIVKNKKPIIIYTEETAEERKAEALSLKEHVEIKAHFFVRTIPSHLILMENEFYFPDVIYETHPAHREKGFFGEQLARKGFNVIFYTTEMNAPYKHEVKDSKEKEELLNKVYPSQADLWKYEKKYILFSGYCKWVFNK